MTNKENKVFEVLESDNDLWNKVFEELTDREIGGYIPAEELYPWVDEQLLKPVLIAGLKDGTYKWSVPRKVYLIKPGTSKKRVVYIYSNRDRLVQALLCRVIASVYDHKVHPKCFSYRQGVSTISAVKEVFTEINQRNMYSVKLDISSYFYNVQREYIINQLDALFDKEGVLYSLLKGIYCDDRIFDRRERDDRPATEDEVRVSKAMHGHKGHNLILKNEYKSLVAGSSPSGFMSNCLLYGLDELVSSMPGVVYGRYCDDILVAAETRELLTDAFGHIRRYLESMKLEVNEKKVFWFEPEDSITFLGIRTYVKDGKRIYDVCADTVALLKKFVKQESARARKKIEKKKLTGAEKELVMIKLVMKINYLLFKCYIEDKRKFGWAYYAFRCINVIDSLKVLDYYICDTLRWVWTGRHNKYNVKAVPKEKLAQYGYVSLVDMYDYFKTDFDLYKNIVYKLTDGIVTDNGADDGDILEQYMEIMSNPLFNRSGLCGVTTDEES